MRRTLRSRPGWQTSAIAVIGVGFAACSSAPPDATQFCGVYTEVVSTDPIVRTEALVSIESILTTDFGAAHSEVINDWLALRTSGERADADDLATFDGLDRLHSQYCVPSEDDQRIDDDQVDDQRRND